MDLCKDFLGEVSIKIVIAIFHLQIMISKLKKMDNNHCFFKVTNSVLASLILFQTNDKKSEKDFHRFFKIPT
jgi:hypothetical protein